MNRHARLRPRLEPNARLQPRLPALRRGCLWHPAPQETPASPGQTDAPAPIREDIRVALQPPDRFFSCADSPHPHNRNELRRSHCDRGLTNLVAVPLSGPILILGHLGTLAGNVVAPLAYLVNASNGLLVRVAQGASALSFAAVATPGAMLPLVGLFYLGCVPASSPRTRSRRSGDSGSRACSCCGRRSGSCSSPCFRARIGA